MNSNRPSKVVVVCVVLICLAIAGAPVCYFTGVFGGNTIEKVELQDGEYAIVIDRTGKQKVVCGKDMTLHDVQKDAAKILCGDIFADLTAAETLLTTAEQNLVNRDRDIALKANDIERKNAEIMDLDVHNADLLASVLKLKSEKTVLQGQHETDEQALEVAKLRYAQLSARLAQKSSEYAAEIKEVVRLNREIVKLNVSNAALKAEVAKLKARFAKPKPTPTPAAATPKTSCRKPVVTTHYQGTYDSRKGIQKGTYRSYR